MSARGRVLGVALSAALLTSAANVSLTPGGGSKQDSARAAIATQLEQRSGAAPRPRAPRRSTVPGSARGGRNQHGLTWGHDARPPSLDWAKPALANPTRDQVFGTRVRRMTTADGTRFDRNTYSRRQAENSDGTLFLTYHGDAEYRVYDRLTGELVRRLAIHPDSEPQWHPANPRRIRHIAGSNELVGDLKLYEYDLLSDRDVVVADLTARVRTQLPSAAYLTDRAEGSPSADGNRYAWMVGDAAGRGLGIVSFDLASDRILGLSAPLRPGDGQLDWVSMSPTGDYVVAGYWYGIFVYDADLGNERRVNSKADHSDIALQLDGSDAYVYIDFSSGPDAGFLVAVDLATLARQRLFEVYGGANTSIHVSGKGFDRPGWVIVSTYNCKDPGAWTCDKVVAVELTNNARVLNLAHTYNCGENYWTEPQAAVNRGFTRAYFNSDGGSCGIDAEVYELTLPAFD